MDTPNEIRAEQDKSSIVNQLCQTHLGSNPEMAYLSEVVSSFQDQSANNAEQARVQSKHAVLANRVAKICNNPEILYKRKGQYLSAMRRLRHLFIKEAAIAPIGIVLTVAFGHSQIHVLSHQLDSDVQAEIAPIVSTLLRRKTQSLSHGGLR
jgi:hypothetical protein